MTEATDLTLLHDQERESLSFGLSVSGVSEASPRRKHGEPNEDNFCVAGYGGGFAGFDGLGMNYAGDLASAAAAESMRQSFNAQDPNAIRSQEQAEAFMRDVFVAADKAVRDIPREEEWGEYLGPETTACAVYLWQDLEGKRYATLAHIGDTVALMTDNQGRIKAITVSDIVYAEGLPREGKSQVLSILGTVRSREDLEVMAAQYPHLQLEDTFGKRGQITRSLGAHGVAQDSNFDPSFLTVELETGDGIVVLSDGITDNLPFEDVINTILAYGEDSLAAAQALIAQATQVSLDETNFRHKQDDMTAIVAIIGPAEETQIVVNEIYPKIEPAMKSPSNLKEISSILATNPVIASNFFRSLAVLFNTQLATNRWKRNITAEDIAVDLQTGFCKPTAPEEWLEGSTELDSSVVLHAYAEMLLDYVRGESAVDLTREKEQLGLYSSYTVKILADLKQKHSQTHERYAYVDIALSEFVIEVDEDITAVESLTLAASVAKKLESAITSASTPEYSGISQLNIDDMLNTCAYIGINWEKSFKEISEQAIDTSMLLDLIPFFRTLLDQGYGETYETLQRAQLWLPTIDEQSFRSQLYKLQNQIDTLPEDDQQLQLQTLTVLKQRSGTSPREHAILTQLIVLHESALNFFQEYCAQVIIPEQVENAIALFYQRFVIPTELTEQTSGLAHNVETNPYYLFKLSFPSIVRYIQAVEQKFGKTQRSDTQPNKIVGDFMAQHYPYMTLALGIQPTRYLSDNGELTSQLRIADGLTEEIPNGTLFAGLVNYMIYGLLNPHQDSASTVPYELERVMTSKSRFVYKEAGNRHPETWGLKLHIGGSMDEVFQLINVVLQIAPRTLCKICSYPLSGENAKLITLYPGQDQGSSPSDPIPNLHNAIQLIQVLDTSLKKAELGMTFSHGSITDAGVKEINGEPSSLRVGVRMASYSPDSFTGPNRNPDDRTKGFVENFPDSATHQTCVQAFLDAGIVLIDSGNG